jgi:phage replication-related protein YjqB (UPF0714/DUF867 family)
MSHFYSDYASLAAAETEGVDYERRSVTVSGATWTSIAIHGGGIEAASGEMARYVGAGLMNHYEFAGIKSSGNSILHVESTLWDEPNCVAMVGASIRTLSFHGYTGTTDVAETALGGLDTDTLERIRFNLEAAGFSVVDAGGEIAGDSPNNICNENANSAGVQLEMSRALRESFFTNGDLSQANRDAGNYTQDFYDYANAIIAAFDGEAKIDQGSINVSRYGLIASTKADVDLQVNMATDVAATGGPHFLQLVARHLDTSNNYLARVAFNEDQTITLTLRKRVGGSESLLATASSYYTNHLTHAANRYFTLRFQVTGSTLRAKVWQTGQAVPDDWQVTTTDTDLTLPGSVGIRAILSSANTNTLPVTASFDDFRQMTSQTFTVARSTNGVVKSHPAGSDIRLAYPAITSH